MKEKTVIAVVGLPTTGKTTLAREISKVTGFHYVDIDAGPAACAPPQESDPYRSEEAKTREQLRMRVAYTVLHEAVKANLSQGFSVIVSATYSRYAAQEFLEKAVSAGGGTLRVVRFRYNDTREEIERRINDRVSRGAVGGCRSVSHYLADKERYAGIKLPHVVVHMQGGEEGTAIAPKRVFEYIEYMNGE